jgi:outer membrane protein assembly factor BamB
LAIGYDDKATIDLLDGHSLVTLPRPNTNGLDVYNLIIVTWSKDGRTLYAGGRLERAGESTVLAWANAGRGDRRALPDGRLLVAASDPFLELLAPDGRPRWAHRSPNVDFRNQRMAMSADGAIVDFGFELSGKSSLRFDLRALKLSSDLPDDRQRIPPKQTGVAVEGWKDGYSPTLDGKPIKLEQFEQSRSLAIHPNGDRFVLGADWSLQAIDAKGEQLWKRATPGTVWAVNISGDGRLVVAAYDDGTIRWHRMDDGSELLALYVLADKQNWVAPGRPRASMVQQTGSSACCNGT